jgi:hypothetical protein
MILFLIFILFFLDILDNIIQYKYNDIAILPKLQQFIKLVHKNTYISGDYVHFTSSFLFDLSCKTTRKEHHDGIYCDICDLLVSVYSQKVVEKNGNCKEFCSSIIDAFKYGLNYYHGSLLSAHQMQIILLPSMTC